MEIIELKEENLDYVNQTAKLLVDIFPDSYEDSSLLEVEKTFRDDHIGFVAIENNKVIGFIGAISKYGTTGWELHPLIVDKSVRSKGIGSKLVKRIEEECKKRGAITIYLGSDDEDNKTSLSNTDLYVDTFEKIKSIKNYNNHPYEFYQKLGYKIVGVFPDVNGIGKPDIWMAKRLK